MFGLLTRTGKNLVKNTAVGVFNKTKAVKGFLDESLEDAKFQGLNEELNKFNTELSFLSEDERKAVLERSKELRLEALAEKKSKMVVQQAQLSHKRNSQASGAFTPEQMELIKTMFATK